VTIGVTDHAVERYLQRVRGVLDPRPEIAGRVRAAWEAGRVVAAERGTVHVRDIDRPDLVYVCVHDRPRDELRGRLECAAALRLRCGGCAQPTEDAASKGIGSAAELC